MAKCPKTAEKAFKKLDELLSEEDKRNIRDAEDLCVFHFGLGMWIRNQWIHTGEWENVRLLLKDMGVDFLDFTEEIREKFPEEAGQETFFMMHPDDASGYILEAYQKYLKEK